jgi:predicted alpha/beta superfamily hydrolase
VSLSDGSATGEWRPYPVPEEEAAHPAAPSLLVLEQLYSPELGTHRDILVALPASAAPGDLRYPVVYMHDGQNLFDPATSYAGHWELAATLAYHALEGLEAIVVGIPNMGRRRRYEYSPFRDPLHGGGGGDRYLQFLCETLKPRIDAAFPTLADAASTAVAGSSLGGLISLYALFRRPHTFGVAGVLSPALWFAGGAIFDYVRQAAGPGGRIYLDIGTAEGEDELREVRRLRDLLVERGFRPGHDLVYVEDEGADHHESAWARRLRDTLPYLVAGRPAGRAAEGSDVEA